MNTAAGYAWLEHTADLGLRVWGPAPNEVFTQAARALYAAALNRLRKTGHGHAEEFEVHGEGYGVLLHHFLRELMYRLYVHQRAGLEWRWTFDRDRGLRVKAHWHRQAPEQFQIEMKNPTYHRLAWNPRPGGGVEATIYFDI